MFIKKWINGKLCFGLNYRIDKTGKEFVLRIPFLIIYFRIRSNDLIKNGLNKYIFDYMLKKKVKW
jgi:hypothetical protein